MIYCRKALSLSELLLAITIVGIVASYTIPNLLYNFQEAQFRTAWKRSFSILSQAASRIRADNGGTLANIFSSHNTTRNYFFTYLTYTKLCNTSATLGVCWHNNDGSFTELDGSPIVNQSGSDMAGGIMTNGSLIKFIYRSSDCTNTSGGVPHCGYIQIDVNGFKAPNKVGKDVYQLYIQDNKLTPRGIMGDTAQPISTCSTSNSGWGCSAKYLMQ